MNTLTKLDPGSTHYHDYEITEVIPNPRPDPGSTHYEELPYPSVLGRRRERPFEIEHSEADMRFIMGGGMIQYRPDGNFSDPSHPEISSDSSSIVILD